MTRNCMAMGESWFRHFPAGTYYDQIATELGQLELDLMREMERMWLIFAVKDVGSYTAADMKYIGWLEKDERVNALNQTVAIVWGIDLKQHGKHYPKLSD